MARMIAMLDLAQAIADAGAAPVRDGATVASIDIEIATLAASPPTDAGFWAMRLRYPDPPRLALLAGWRRARRRRAGVAIVRVLLRWTPGRLDALVDGRAIGQFDPITRSNDR